MHIKIFIIFDDMTDVSQSSDVIFMKNGFDKLQIYRYQLKKKIVYQFSQALFLLIDVTEQPFSRDTKQYYQKLILKKNI